MSENNRVVWSEGMFLRPQHFQQHDRYVESLVRGLSQDIRAYTWGFSRLKLDHANLAIGKLGLSLCSGVFQDGTPFNLPQDDDLPLPLEVPEDEKASVVYLALPIRRSDSTEVDSEPYPDNMARFRLSERQVRDHNSGADGRYDVQIGALKPRLMCDSQERSGYVCLGVARIIEMRADKTVILDEQYIPPAVHCSSAGLLGGFVKELQGMFHTRGEALAARVAGGGQGGGVAEIADFMLLQMINRYQPLLTHLANAATLHPEDFFQLCLQLAGELSTFYRPNKRPIDFPDYKHDDLKASFMPLIDELRALLSMILEQNAVQIPLAEVKPGVYVAKRPDLKLLEGSVFVLAAKAQVSSELLRSHFAPQVKIGPVENIQQLVRSALPGIDIQALPVVPRQLPYHAGYSYFELNKQSELWGKMPASGGFGIHIGGNFPELELEFWAIRKG
ncbi:type VI secretion system baseplate subunit TssK [Methylomonas sp. LL1]|uniref:type VI secretion system baseplate subunit TssK n=1 Tax=Methylomonas sp. LL1 TaxID=2785785 RepID=UPI0018C413C6|nr:type VI secretion system baseplate subunit TssK [Methylomonas sp. LL1]QPK63470.1 type VI secretion system baseplate subunit TssK [Methylomonas sp. LL1]